MFESESQLQSTLSPLFNHQTIHDEQSLRGTVIDQLIHTAVFAEDEALKNLARKVITDLSLAWGCPSSSIRSLYSAIGKGELAGFTVPAVNIRTLTYQTARLIFRLMMKHEIGAVVFEIARSEIEYTDQRPAEYTASVLAAAIKEGYKGPVFLQGDHYQFSKSKFIADKEAEIKRLKDLIEESVKGQFFNIDIDASTLVDLEQKSLSEQQRNNYEMTALLTDYVRSLEPSHVSISLGGEIGHIGGKNSTVDDFRAFMEGYNSLVSTEGISKVSVQTGTSHGGIPLSDGTIQEVALDFSVLEKISDVARKEYHMGGAVQHGASTLPLSLFDKFVESKTLEIHLATGLQNIVYDNLPHDLKQEIYDWIKETCRDEWEEGWNEEQFLYKTRKKALGPFKQVLWELTEDELKQMLLPIEKQLETIFEKLRCFNTKKTISQYV